MSIDVEALIRDLEAEGVVTWADPGHRARFIDQYARLVPAEDEGPTCENCGKRAAVDSETGDCDECYAKLYGSVEDEVRHCAGCQGWYAPKYLTRKVCPGLPAEDEGRLQEALNLAEYAVRYGRKRRGPARVVAQNLLDQHPWLRAALAATPEQGDTP